MDEDRVRADRRPSYVALNCTLTPSPRPSSTDRLLGVITGLLDDRGFTGSCTRVVDHHVAFGVTDDEGSGDEWPRLRSDVLEADVVVLGTPIWLGHPSSVAQMVLERLDALLEHKDSRGQLTTVDKVAMVAVVGNEDGAHHVGASLFQGLNDVGFTLAPMAMTYWVGEAMGSVDFKDLDEVPDTVMSTATTMVANATHLVRTLAEHRYPPLEHD
jgi:multimeric flavodoxin WrbA